MRLGTATPMTVTMPEMTLIDAVTTALAWELEHDSRVVVLGEDVGVNGGVFRATAGLQAKFGADRVQDTPLAEGMIAGVAIGMAAHGMIPVPEIQQRIHVVRGKRVMLDADLARFYGVGTRDLNKAVSRNLDRFPDDFSFVLTKEEHVNLMFQVGTSSLHVPLL